MDNCKSQKNSHSSALRNELLAQQHNHVPQPTPETPLIRPQPSDEVPPLLDLDVDSRNDGTANTI